MSETTYIKSFLQTLDSKPTKYPADHIFDSKTFPPRLPYTLPKLPHPPHPLPSKSSSTVPPAPAPGSTPSTAPPSSLLKIHLSSTRPPTISLTLPPSDPSITTLTHLKQAVLKALGDPEGLTLEKVKILSGKKPVTGGAGRTVAEVLEEAGGATKEGNGKGEVEFGVMVIGGAGIAAKATPAAAPAAAAPPMDGIEKTQSLSAPAQGPSGVEVLHSAEFWDDLQGFLEQRLKSEEEARRLKDILRSAWKGASS
ncbi:MAG: hypothetical protein Q9160_004119 [Pyrenula sp. 1 TL-2023]